MAVQTYALVGDGNAIGVNDFGKLFSKKVTLDTATTNVASGDVVKLMVVPKDTYILNVVANVTTAEGGTLTIDVGDYLTADDSAVDADGFLDGFNGNSAAATATRDQLAEDTTTLGWAEGKFYRAAGSYIGALFNNAADAAVIDFHIIGIDCR